MAITQVGSTTTGSADSSGSFSITKPTGVQSGDVLVVFGCSNEGAWDTLPSGFTQIAVSVDADTTNNFRGYAWYKVCGGSEPSSYSFGSTTAGGSGAPMVASMTAWRGAANVNPISHSSITAGGGLAEPANPSTSFTQADQGRLMYARMARRVSASSGVAEIPTFTNGTAQWSELSDNGAFSGGTVNYGIGVYAQDNDTGSGARVEPAITCSNAESDGVFILLCVEAIATGPIGATLAPVTSSFAATREIPAGSVDAQIPSITSQFDGLGAPPSGTLDTALAPVTASIAATSIGGPLAATTPSVSADVAGSVNPIGSWSSTLAPVSATVQAETKPFGEHVIVVEPDHRAFLVTDDEVGLKLIKRSQVTNA